MKNLKAVLVRDIICLPDYFGGDCRAWVTVYPTEKGYTSRELRKAILLEFAQGAIGGNQEYTQDFISGEDEQLKSDQFFKTLEACLNRDIKYRGKKHKLKDYDITENDLECGYDLPLWYFVFDME